MQSAVTRLQIDTRAEAELRRLSGGNQQKVVLARWISHGFKTLLCFDPTRGIDVGTKRQIYSLIRELAAAGSSILLFTSELPEIQLACDRAIVCSRAVSSTKCQPPKRTRRHCCGPLMGWFPVSRSARDSAERSPAKRSRWSYADQRPAIGVDTPRRALSARHRDAASPCCGLAVHDLDSSEFRCVRHPVSGSRRFALGFAAAAQTCVVISGGIDLSVGSLIAVANVLAASTMQHADFRQALLLAVAILIAGAISGAINGVIVVLSRIPDVVVTLTTGFIWGGVALLIMEKPGGGAPQQFLDLAGGTSLAPWLPNAVLLLIVAVAVVWIPLKLSRVGLLIYAGRQ